jgi:hypothetical protein
LEAIVSFATSINNCLFFNIPGQKIGAIGEGVSVISPGIFVDAPVMRSYEALSPACVILL